MVGATGHLGHPLAQEVGGHEGGGQSVVGGAIAQLAVTVVAPSKDLSIYRAADKLFFKAASVVNIFLRANQLHFLFTMMFSNTVLEFHRGKDPVASTQF